MEEKQQYFRDPQKGVVYSHASTNDGRELNEPPCPSRSGLCPKGDDPLTTDQADRALILRTSAEEGPLIGELSLTFNGETTVFDANAQRTGDQECASALQALPNIDRVACTRGAVSEFGGADYLISLLR